MGDLSVISEREKLEFESLPEFIREPYTARRESFMPPPPSKAQRPEEKLHALEEKLGPVWHKHQSFEPNFADVEDDLVEISRPRKHEALDTLWAGVDREMLEHPSRSPSFYLTIGFMAGAIISLVGVWGYSLVSHAVTAGGTGDGGKKIVVAGAGSAAQKAPAVDNAAHTTVVNGREVIAPAFSTYEVKAGDTLAGIALKAYHRVSPRLLDTICQVNNLRSAHVLSLGQKLALPEYHPQSSGIASWAASPAM